LTAKIGWAAGTVYVCNSPSDRKPVEVKLS
jgi:hypothetical protein